MSSSKEMVILTQTYDLLTWLLPQCEGFPKSQRFVVTQRLQGAALDFQEALFDANARAGTQRLECLQAADAHLDKLRLYLRLARQWSWLGNGQYRHVSTMVAEIGRLLGGWMKTTRGQIARGEDGRHRAAREGGGGPRRA
jgi:hypothetical protein